MGRLCPCPALYAGGPHDGHYTALTTLGGYGKPPYGLCGVSRLARQERFSQLVHFDGSRMIGLAQHQWLALIQRFL